MKKKKKKNTQGVFQVCVVIYFKLRVGLEMHVNMAKSTREYVKALEMKIDFPFLLLLLPAVLFYQNCSFSRLWKGNDLLKNNETEIVCSMLAECLVCA